MSYVFDGVFFSSSYAHRFYKIKSKAFKQKIATDFSVAIFCISYFLLFIPFQNGIVTIHVTEQF